MANHHYFDQQLDQIDWDYAKDASESFFSGLHFHPGRYISQIPSAIIGALSSPGETVLDPFCGSGTTLVEAQRLNRRSIGIDINPVSVLISRAKLLSNRASQVFKLIEVHSRRISNLRMDHTYQSIDHNSPTSVQLNKWYHHETAHQLQQLWSYTKESSGYSKLLLEFCFSSILISACSERRHWGYVCDNTRPLQKIYVDAFDLMQKSLASLAKAYAGRDRALLKNQKFPLTPAIVIEGSASDKLRTLPAQVDLIMTSPPYYGVVDYIKSQRLSMEWFNQPLHMLRNSEIGARSKRSRKDAFNQYMDDMSKFFLDAFNILKPDRYMTIVLGESPNRPPVIPDLTQKIQDIGFNLIKNDVRSISIGRAQTPGILNESILIFKKPL